MDKHQEAKYKNNVPVVELIDAELRYGDRRLWSNLNLKIMPGEFIAILGPNGSGKTSLLRVLLGLNELSNGSVKVNGEAPRKGSNKIGYVPQQKAFDKDLPIRGRDLVRLGLDGHRYGITLTSSLTKQLVQDVLEGAGATEFADSPIGLLSGGEQQRLCIAQALIGNPAVLLCDEPLLSLDIAHQQIISQLIDERRREHDTAVLFVTHEINPILSLVDKVVYLVDGKWAIGKPEDVMTSEKLSELYGTSVEVIKVKERIIVVGSDDASITEPLEHHHAHIEGKSR